MKVNKLDYQLFINNKILINPPLKIDFNVKKSIDKVQECNIDIYNLNPDTRENINRSYSENTKQDRQTIELYASSTNEFNELQLLFVGYANTIKSKHSETDWITHIDAFSGKTEYASYTNISIKNSNDIINKLKNDMNLGDGHISNNDIFKVGYRGRSFEGSSLDILKKNKKNNHIFIDNNKLFILNEKEILTQDKLLISNESGLISVEEKENFLEIEIIFNSYANIGNQCDIVTKYQPNLNGTYRINELEHNVTISAFGGDTQGTTKLQLERIK